MEQADMKQTCGPRFGVYYQNGRRLRQMQPETSYCTSANLSPVLAHLESRLLRTWMKSVIRCAPSIPMADCLWMCLAAAIPNIFWDILFLFISTRMAALKGQRASSNLPQVGISLASNGRTGQRR